MSNPKHPTNMRYSLIFLAVLFLLPISAKDKKQIEGNSPYDYKFSYIKEQHLLSGDSGLTIVTLNLEWPEVLNHYTSENLQLFLCQHLFSNNETSLGKGLSAFLNSRGKEISRIPDNPGKINYISIDLEGIAWEKDRYISYKYSVYRRNSDSLNLSQKDFHLFTHDIAMDKIYMTPNLIRNIYKSPGSVYHDILVSMVLAVMGPNDEFLIDEIPGESCMVPEGLAMALKDVKEVDDHYKIVVIPRHLIKSVVFKDAWKMLGQKTEKRKLSTVTDMEVVYDSDPVTGVDTTHIYKVVDTKPEYMEGMEGIIEYMSKNVKYPQYESILGVQGKVVVQFVVERDGSVSHPVVLEPVTPGLAQEAVRLVLSMPKWKPATKNGVPVRTLCHLPISFRQQPN